MYLTVNAVSLYYEEYGSGQPIIFLHGNSESSEIYQDIAHKLESRYNVFLIDSRCHGKSSDGELTYELMSKDIVEFIRLLNIQNPIICGFSDGAIVALLMAIDKEVNLSKIILLGVNYKYKGMKFKSRFSLCLATLFNKNNKFNNLMIKQKDISEDSLKNIECQTIIICGENDVIKLSHSIKLNNLIRHSKFEMVKNENHSSYVFNNAKLLNIIEKYL